MKVVRMDSLTKFSPDTYCKIPINDTKGLIRLLCFEPNQHVPLHKHLKADEYFFVMKGEGKITIGNEEAEAKQGYMIKAPAGVAHQWKNGPERLTLLSVLIHPSSYEHANETVKMEFV